MGRLLRVTALAIAGLLATGCLSSEPKIAEIEQVAAVQREEMQAATEAAAGGGGEGGGGTTTFVAIDIAYEEAPAEVAAGTEVELDNQGSIEHNVVIEQTDETILDATGGSTDSATIDLEPGSYTYYCDVPGHREAGMEGELTVQ